MKETVNCVLCLIVLCFLGCEKKADGPTPLSERAPEEQREIKHARNCMKKVIERPVEATFLDGEVIVDDPISIWYWPEKSNQKTIYGKLQTGAGEIHDYILTYMVAPDAISRIETIYRGDVIDSPYVAWWNADTLTLAGWQKKNPAEKHTILLTCILDIQNGRIDREWRETVLPEAMHEILPKLEASDQGTTKTIDLVRQFGKAYF